MADRPRPWWLLPTKVSLVAILLVLGFASDLPDRPAVGLELVAEGLIEPVSVVGFPSDAGRFLVVERAGRVMEVIDGVVEHRPVLDWSSEVTTEGPEQGMLAIALHPDFAANGRAFLYFTDRRGDVHLEEVTLNERDATEAPGSRRVLLVIEQPDPYHNGGGLAFGPDGYLYVGVGDGGLLPGGWRDGRDPASLLGKILRIDVDRPGDRPYAIPADNPLIHQVGALPEIWAIGFRNPWRISFDAQGGHLWVADVGQVKWEEVDAIPWPAGAGANLGWNLYEGRACFERSACDPTGVMMPLVSYPHASGNCAVIGGLVHRGRQAFLYGRYVFGDHCSGRLWLVDADPMPTSNPVPQGRVDGAISSFGQGADGSVYLTTLSGELYRLVPAV